MARPREFAFPEGTVFFRMDGVLFAALQDERWFALDDGGQLVALNEPYAAEVGRMVDVAEVVDAAEFYAAMAGDAALPAEPQPQ